MATLGQALALAGVGYKVFPLIPGSKLPAIKDFPNRATSDPDEIRRFWTCPFLDIERLYNVGISTSSYGDGESLVAIDVDEKDGRKGGETLTQLELEGCDIPKTYEQTTPTGGRHLVYRCPAPLKQGAAKLGRGLDIRANGGFIVGAGSELETGAYTAERLCAPTAAPQWLIDRCGPAEPKRRRKPNGALKPTDPRDWRRAVEYLRTAAPRGVDGARNATAYTVACQLFNLGIAEPAECATLLVEFWPCEPALDSGELEAVVDSAFDRAQEAVGSKSPHSQFEPVETAPDAAGTRPTIKIVAGDVHGVATKAEQALIDAGAPIFVRGSELVRPVIEDVDAAKGGRTKAVRLRELGPDALVDHLNRAARWIRYDRRTKKDLAADPPHSVAATILSRDGEWRLRRLGGVLSCPSLRPDGSLLAEAGYDAETRLLVVSPPVMPPIPDKPTKADAMAALALLDGLLDEFPFLEGADRSVALSGLISPVVRGALGAVPMHVIRAPSAGSGKSFLVDLCSAIATGQRAPVIAAGRDEAETEKRLDAVAMSGQPIISLDNINGDIFGDKLCLLVERPVVQVRPLGRSQEIRIENRACIYGTGNNAKVAGDMVRRTLLCELDANQEAPERREFRNNPLAAILDDRGRYIAAVLTIARAYIVAGFPDARPALASFEDWSRLVRSPLVWLGRADPVETQDRARDEDPEISALRHLVGAWRDVIGTDAPLTTGELVNRAMAAWGKAEERRGAPNPEPLHEALSSIAADHGRGGTAINRRSLGKWLARNKGRIAHGLKISEGRSAHLRQPKWSLHEVAGFGGFAGFPPSLREQSVSDSLLDREWKHTRQTTKPRKSEPGGIHADPFS